MKIKTRVTLPGFIDRYLQYINLFTKERLNEKDIELMKHFLLLPDKFEHARFSLPAKRLVAQYCTEDGWKQNSTVITNRLYSIHKKGFLTRDEDGVLYFKDFVINPINEFKKNKKFELNVEFEEYKANI